MNHICISLRNSPWVGLHFALDSCIKGGTQTRWTQSRHLSHIRRDMQNSNSTDVVHVLIANEMIRSWFPWKHSPAMPQVAFFFLFFFLSSIGCVCVFVRISVNVTTLSRHILKLSAKYYNDVVVPRTIIHIIICTFRTIHSPHGIVRIHLNYSMTWWKVTFPSENHVCVYAVCADCWHGTRPSSRLWTLIFQKSKLT